MLSAADCRNTLGRDCKLTADELDSLLPTMYKLARSVVDEFLRIREPRQGSAEPAEAVSQEHQAPSQEPDESQLLFPDALQILPADQQERLRERAAIVEFEGGADRSDAERIALLDHLLIKE